MSGSSLTETDPVLQIYEAWAIIIEQIEKIGTNIRRIQEKDAESEQMRQEIERLRMENNFNKNQQELAQKVTKLETELTSKIDNLRERLETLELAANHKEAKIEEKLAVSNLELKDQIAAMQMTVNEKELEQELTDAKASNFNLINRLTSLELNVNHKQESSTKQNTSILILGGWESLDTIYLLDSRAQSWKKLRITLPMGMLDFGAVVLNEEIYICGGNANYTYQQGCYKLKNDGSWMQLASMNQKRSDISSSSLVYKGDIWVIGGAFGDFENSEDPEDSEDSKDPEDSEDFREYLKSVERYDISQDKWIYMPEMNFPRCNAAAAVFKDRIFVTGGYSKEYLKSVEVFDPKLQKWILFCDLLFEVSGHTMLISNSILSIFGGRLKSGRLNSVWEMDIEDPERKWTKKQSFKHPRSSFGIGNLSNGIIVFGGWKNNRETSEIFHGNKWIDGPKLPQDLSQFAYTPISRSLEKKLLEFKYRDKEDFFYKFNKLTIPTSIRLSLIKVM